MTVSHMGESLNESSIVFACFQSMKGGIFFFSPPHHYFSSMEFGLLSRCTPNMYLFTSMFLSYTLLKFTSTFSMTEWESGAPGEFTSAEQGSSFMFLPPTPQKTNSSYGYSLLRGTCFIKRKKRKLLKRLCNCWNWKVLR